MRPRPVTREVPQSVVDDRWEALMAEDQACERCARTLQVRYERLIVREAAVEQREHDLKATAQAVHDATLRFERVKRGAGLAIVALVFACLLATIYVTCLQLDLGRWP